MGREIMAGGCESGWLLTCPQWPDRGRDLRGSPHGGCVKPWRRPPQAQWATALHLALLANLLELRSLAPSLADHPHTSGQHGDSARSPSVSDASCSFTELLSLGYRAVPP